MNEYTLVTEKLPEKGKDVIAIDSKGDKHYCYRCACKSENCTEWREPITGSAIWVNIVKWKYDKND